MRATGDGCSTAHVALLGPYLCMEHCSGGVAARGSEHCSEVAGDSLLGGVLTFITIVWVLFGCHTHQLRTRIAH